MIGMKKTLSIICSCLILLSSASCGSSTKAVSEPAKSSTPVSAVQAAASPKNETTAEKVAALMKKMSLRQKIAQMLQGAGYCLTYDDMEKHCYGSVLNGGNSPAKDAATWRSFVDGYQQAAMKSALPIPCLYGLDAIHGHNNVQDAVIFPHNIGIGAANDEQLTDKMGAAVAEEMKVTGVLWNFGPCLAVDSDPRWGRTYESYSSDPDLVAKLGAAFAKGQLAHGVMPTAKHFVGDGSVVFGTGEEGKLIDRGDAKLTDAQLEKLLKPYRALLGEGVKIVMASHSSVNGVKMHANKRLLTDKLKGELKFDGFVVSDWESVEHIPGEDLGDKLTTAINAGIDLLMQPENFEQCGTLIEEAVKSDAIPQTRIDDAVRRILTVKYEMGLFDDPMEKHVGHEVARVGTQGIRDLAKQLVEESLVLLKNDKKILPLKKGSTVFVTGPAADNVGVQCGGWTVQWAGGVDQNGRHVTQGTTILQGLQSCAKEYGLTVITDEKQAAKADVTLLCVGEKPYSEWEGDTKDMSLTGSLGLSGNEEAVGLAKKLGKPTVALIVAGREVLIQNYLKDWDSAVMCYLPGSEGEGIADVLVNKTGFRGRLSMPWYKTVQGIGTDDVLFKQGFGLSYQAQS